MKSLIRMVIIAACVLLSSLGFAQTHIFPATDTNNVFSGSNTFNGPVIMNGATTIASPTINTPTINGGILLGTTSISRPNKVFVVGTSDYPDLATAVSAACASGGYGKVELPASGSCYTANSTITACSNLEIAGQGGNGPAAVGGTCINTNLTSGDFFDAPGVLDFWFHNIRVHNTAVGASTSQFLHCHYCQGVVGEQFFVDGDFKNGIVLNPVEGTGSTITNRFSDFQINITGAAGDGARLDALSAINQTVNGNTFQNGAITATANGVHTTGGSGGGNAYINENTFIGIQTYTGGAGTGFQFDDSSTFNTNIISPTIEGNLVGIRSTTGNIVNVMGGEIGVNTTNVSDPNANINFMRCRGPACSSQVFNIDPTGNMRIAGVGINVTPVAGSLSVVSGNGLYASGNLVALLNTTSLQLNKSLDMNSQTLINGAASTFTTVNATTGFQISGAATSGRYLKGNGTNFVQSTGSASGTGSPTSCTNQFVTTFTLNSDAAPTSTCTTATLASAQFANQGTTTTVLHGNAAGNPSFAAVSLTADITGILGGTNGGTGVSSTATFPTSGVINTGTGTTNTIPKFTTGASGIIGNSQITDDGTTVNTNAITRVLCLGINGSSCSAGLVNGATGWQIQASGSSVETFNNTVPEVVMNSMGTTSNCSSSASPAVCGSAAAGSVVIAAGSTSVQVNTTKVTANSQIFVQPDDSLGTKLSVTCNTTGSLLAAEPWISARSAATSFTITINAAPSVNPECFSYSIVN